MTTAPNYEPHEDEIIRNALMNRPEGVSQRQAVANVMNLLPGRTIDGVMYRWHKQLNAKELEEIRAMGRPATRHNGQSPVVKRQKQGGRKGVILEPWQPDEDAILWNTVQTRGETESVYAALNRVVKSQLLKGRTLSSVTNRYYILRDKLEESETVYVPPKPDPAQLQLPPPPPASVWTKHRAEEVPETQPAASPQPAASIEPRLADRAEEFIRSLYGVVEENKALREQVARLKDLERIEADLKNERERTTRLLRQVKEMEEDRDAFLRLMDKARVIGREENGI